MEVLRIMKFFLEENGRKCTGCGACVNSCPQKSIRMIEDSHGFLRAVIDTATCIDCGKCKNVCPQINFVQGKKDIQLCFSVKASDDIRLKSSSGGFFYLLAENVIKKGGIVFGAAYSSPTRVSQISVNSIEDLALLQKSKYVQSNIGNTFKEVKEILNKDIWVLYSGCPCQIAGLKNYLEKDYDNLITVDLVCKGVPSSKCLEEVLGNYITLESVSSIDFRDKSYGWNCDHLIVKAKDGENKVLNAKTDIRDYNFNWFTEAFLKGINTNDACLNCKYAELPRIGDVTIGDFWGIWEIDYANFDQLGTSLLLTNSSKGLTLLGEVQKGIQLLKSQQINNAIKYNRFNAQIMESKKHRRFWDNYGRGDTLNLIKKVCTEKYDVGLVGLRTLKNQGAALLTYATYKFLENEGYSVLLIQQHDESNWIFGDEPFFVRNPYPDYSIAEHAKNKIDMIKYNELCEAFVLGSDQLLASYFYKNYGSCFGLDWVYDMKKKIGYGLSFTKDYPMVDSDMDMYEMQNYLHRFDFISCRENSGCEMLENFYGIEADLTIDPVFLHDEKFYDELTNGINIGESGYILSAIWHLNMNKFINLKKCFSSDYWKNITDGAETTREKMEKYGKIDNIYESKVEEWMLYIKKSELVVTDSYHCMIMAIIYRKNFIFIRNENDAPSRADSLLENLGLTDRSVNDSYDLYEKINALREIKIDYELVYEKLNVYVEKSKNWFRNALQYRKRSSGLSDMDIQKKFYFDNWSKGQKLV